MRGIDALQTARSRHCRMSVDDLKQCGTLGSHVTRSQSPVRADLPLELKRKLFGNGGTEIGRHRGTGLQVGISRDRRRSFVEEHLHRVWCSPRQVEGLDERKCRKDLAR